MNGIFAFVFVCTIATALAGYAGYYQPHEEAIDYHAPANYKYDYAVSDPHTGDHKQQWEHRSPGGHVQGAYSLVEPDGTTRIVEYTSDPHLGFNAVVKKIGHATHPQLYGHEAGHGHY
ncbi:cuticle protein 19-like [Chrysoperla carnea]|uniref:cuticle protein 19-like n=1 Tax=Chrysoperla carnea TaxID=189513 RepID=UPI001D06D05A|nr:cuticle protein 19-like [Chrysoperla carnea]